MTTVRFQSEPEELINKSELTSVRNTVSDQSLSLALQSIVLTLCIKDEPSAYDYSTLNRMFENDRSLMIVKDRHCLFPLDIKEEDFSLCLVLQDGDLNVCDLQGRHTFLAAEIENSWPSLLAAANKVRELFSESDAALLINRTSGRVLATSTGFSAISGLTDDECTGREYGDLRHLLGSCFSGRKIRLQNLNVNDLYLSIVTFFNAAQTYHSQNLAEPPIKSADSYVCRLLDESHAVGLYVSRFNALLESNLRNTLYTDTLAQLEQVVSELTRYCRTDGQYFQTEMDSPGINACLRFLVQSNVMSHRSSAGESAKTEIALDFSQKEAIRVSFKTPANDSTKPAHLNDEWRELAENLAKRIGVQISELQIINKTIVNGIQITLKPTQSNYAQ